MAGAWTMLVDQQERRKQMSSTRVARCGSRSETSRPDWPCLENLRVLARSGVSPLVNWLTGLPKLSGSGLPCHLARSGFGSNRSTWLGPPTMNVKITDLALASWCGFLAASGLPVTFSLPYPSRASSQESASDPKPPPARTRKSRRVRAGGREESNWRNASPILPTYFFFFFGAAFFAFFAPFFTVAAFFAISNPLKQGLRYAS